MSYMGIRVDKNNKVWVRYRVKGEHLEAGPYDNAVEALRENMGRDRPLTSTQERHIISVAGTNSGASVKE